MGRIDQQREAGGGGNNSSRADIQLNNGGAELDGSAFSVFQTPKTLPDLSEQRIDAILKYDDYFRIKRGDIVKFFLNNENASDRAEFMKTVFNGDYSEFDADNVRCGYKAWDEGLELWTGNYLTKTEESRLSWEETAQRIGSLIEAHEYLDKTEEPEFFDIEPSGGEDGGEAVQLSLFDTDDTQDISIEAKEKPKKAELTLALELSITEEILRGTGTEQGKLRILDYYRENKPDIKDFAKFLKRDSGIYHRPTAFKNSDKVIASNHYTFDIKLMEKTSFYISCWQ